MIPTVTHFSHAATVLPVADVAQSSAFYRDKLGFELTFTWEEPITYAVLKGGDQVHIHLTKRMEDYLPSSHHTALYIFVHDVDELYQTYLANDVTITNPIGTRDYGMRDFDIRDPDGHILCFGKGK